MGIINVWISGHLIAAVKASGKSGSGLMQLPQHTYFKIQ